MTDKRLSGPEDTYMAAHSRKYKVTSIMESSAGALASSMRCLEETMKLLETSREALNNSGAVRKLCWICGKAICLETCTIDEHGCAVHEQCYVAKLSFANESVKLSKYDGI
jgi:hypothetical protein